MVEVGIEFIVNFFLIAFRITLPIFCSMFLINIILGILARIAPQMNMFAVGIQIKLLAGLTIMMIITITMPTVSSFIYEEIKKMMVVAVQIMST